MSKINIPYYREKEIKKLYEIFSYEEKNNDINIRKKKFYKILKAKYNWINNEEYQEMYKIIKENELIIIFDSKKREISQKYKKNLIKLFSIEDNNNNNVLDINEFKMLMLKFHICDYNNIQEMFSEADLNGDGLICIDEFIEFLTIKNELLERLDKIIECKQDYDNSIDRRTLLFTDFPGSPLKNNSWTPSLSNLRSPNSIKKELYFKI